MESNGGIQSSLGGRYATALFDLARGGRQIDAVEESLDAVRRALAESPDFAALTRSPVLGRTAAAGAIAAVAGEMGLDPLTTRFLGVLAENRRLRDLPAIIRAFRALASAHRGEATAEVTAAHPLTDAQVDELRQALRQRVGREVAVDVNVDPALLGGLVIRMGSQMIDSSIRTRLNSLAHAMKG